MVKGNFFLIFFILFSITISGCSIYHISSLESTTDYYPPKKSVNDVIYLEKIDRPFETIGEVIVNTERRQTINDVMDKIKYEASVLGADAITNIRTDATGTWKKLPAHDLLKNGYVRTNFSATAVIFK